MNEPAEGIQDSNTDVLASLKNVRMIALDVDGTLTNGVVTYSSDGSETKQFHIADGLGLQLAIQAGLVVAWITGRTSETVQRRADELNIHHTLMGVSNKAAALAELRGAYDLSAMNIAYMGDDLNDLPAFSVAGVRFAPSNAVAEIKSVADFVTEREGGSGAVREMIDAILKAQGLYTDALTLYLGELLRPKA